jgi:hypothetical protein
MNFTWANKILFPVAEITENLEVNGATEFILVACLRVMRTNVEV